MANESDAFLVCHADGKTLVPCKFLRGAMDGPMQAGSRAKGLFMLYLWNIDTKAHETGPTRTCAALKTGEHQKNGICLNFCPFCGEDIHSHFVEKPNAD